MVAFGNISDVIFRERGRRALIRLEAISAPISLFFLNSFLKQVKRSMKLLRISRPLTLIRDFTLIFRGTISERSIENNNHLGLSAAILVAF